MKTSNPKLQIPKARGESRRAGARRLRRLDARWSWVARSGVNAALLSLVAATRMFAATNSAELDQIPALRPPRAEIPPTFWEQYGVWVVVGGVALLAIACGAVWLLTRPKPPIVVPTEVLAREALEELRQRPEDGVVLSWVSQILRHYVTNAFGLTQGELNTAEFCELIAGDAKVGPELAAAVGQFLRTCDERKFAASVSAPVLGAASQALKIIDRAEARRAELIEAAAAKVPSETAHGG